MKKLIMLVICLMPMMAQAQTELDAEMVGNNDLNQIFLNQSFNQNASIDAVVLSNKEMIETEGEVLPWIIWATGFGITFYSPSVMGDYYCIVHDYC